MLAIRLPTARAYTQSWRWLVFFAFAILLAVTAAKTLSKALKPGRTGEQTRTAFLRWRPQIQALEAGTDVYRSFNYPNPPVMALILRPFVELPPLPGMTAWFILKLAMTVFMARWVFRIADPEGSLLPEWAKLLAFALSVHPILGDLSHGNVNIFISFLVVAGLECYRKNRDYSAGLVIALAIACKITPALFLPYFIWKRAWKTVAGIGLGLALWWVVVPGCILGFEHNTTLLTSWYEVMVKPFAVNGRITSEHANQSLPGLLTRLLTDEPSFIDYNEADGQPFAADTHTIVNLGAGTVSVLVKVLILAFAIMIIVRARTSDRAGLAFAAEAGAVLCAMLLFSERTWKHHATGLLLPTTALLLAAIALKDRWCWRLLGASAVLSIVPSMVSSETQDLLLVYGAYTLVYTALLLGQFRILKLTAVIRE